MFREILLHTSERDFHQFIHRQESGQLVSARMKRLTFGVTTSPFLATQTFHKLADLCEGEHPRVSQLIKSFFYVDDCLAGAATMDEAKALARQLVQVFKSIGMTLRKFRSNSFELLNAIPAELRETSDLNITSPSSAAKTLGESGLRYIACGYASSDRMNSCYQEGSGICCRSDIRHPGTLGTSDSGGSYLTPANVES